MCEKVCPPLCTGGEVQGEIFWTVFAFCKDLRHDYEQAGLNWRKKGDCPNISAQPPTPPPSRLAPYLQHEHSTKLCHVLCVDDSSCTWKSEDDGSVSVLRVLQRWRRVTIQQLSIVESRVKEADLTSVSRLAVSTARSAGRRRDTTPSAHTYTYSQHFTTASWKHLDSVQPIFQFNLMRQWQNA